MHYFLRMFGRLPQVNYYLIKISHPSSILPYANGTVPRRKHKWDEQPRPYNTRVTSQRLRATIHHIVKSGEKRNNELSKQI